MLRRLLSTAAIGLGVSAAPALAESVPYEVGGDAYEGYFAAAEDPRGLVVIVHDWDGLTDYERQRADMLAELGFDAFAIDVYGAGNRPETVEARRAATQEAFADPARLEALVAGGLDAARASSEIDEALVIGYCFGGTVALAGARSGALEDIVGYASFHGNFPDGPEWPADTPPLLILHGGADENPSITDLAAFAQEAEAADLTYEIEVYSGAPHAFTVFGSDSYRERADALSWETFQGFKAQRFEAGS